MNELGSTRENVKNMLPKIFWEHIVHIRITSCWDLKTTSSMAVKVQQALDFVPIILGVNFQKSDLTMLLKGGRMGRSDTVSLWCVSLLINTRFRFFIIE